eukprot:4741830-Amphidinium_carterae.1
MYHMTIESRCDVPWRTAKWPPRTLKALRNKVDMTPSKTNLGSLIPSFSARKRLSTVTVKAGSECLELSETPSSRFSSCSTHHVVLG